MADGMQPTSRTSVKYYSPDSCERMVESTVMTHAALRWRKTSSYHCPLSVVFIFLFPKGLLQFSRHP